MMGKITGRKALFDGKNPWFPVGFPQQTNPMKYQTTVLG